MVVVRTKRCPGATGLGDAVMVHELTPTLPAGTVVVVVVVVDVVLVRGMVVVVVVVVVVGATVVVVVGAAVVVVVPDVVSMVTLEASALDAGPVFPATSVTPLVARRATTVPSEVHVTVTVIEVPDVAEGEKLQPPAEPVLEKSPVAIPETLSENASV
jgi:hypothetical protein